MELELLRPLDSKIHFGVIKYLLNHNLCSHRLKVQFALLCNQDLDRFYDQKLHKEFHVRRLRCLDLIMRWERDPQSALQEDMRVAAENIINIDRNSGNIDAIGDAASAMLGVVIHGTPEVALSAAFTAITLGGDTTAKTLTDWLFNALRRESGIA